MSDEILNLKSCDFQCRLNCLLSFQPCDFRWDEILLEYKSMLVNLRDYCKQLKSRITLMQKTFETKFNEALHQKVSAIKCQVEHEHSMRLHEALTSYRAQLDSEYNKIIESHLETWHSIAQRELELLPESVHELHQAKLDMITCRHQKQLEKLGADASCALQASQHEYEAIISNLEVKMTEMHEHHVECLLRLKRRFSCAPEEINCSDLELWKIPDIPIENQCCDIDYCVPPYSRWKALSVELQSLSMDQQLSVLTNSALGPDVVGQFIAQAEKSYREAVLIHIGRGSADKPLPSHKTSLVAPPPSACYNRVNNGCCENSDKNNCAAFKQVIRCSSFTPTRSDVVWLLSKMKQYDQSFVINYILSTRCGVNLQPGAFVKQFSSHCSLKYQLEIFEMIKDELRDNHHQVTKTCIGVVDTEGRGDAAAKRNACHPASSQSPFISPRPKPEKPGKSPIKSGVTCNDKHLRVIQQFEMERECFAREMMALVDMPIVHPKELKPSLRSPTPCRVSPLELAVCCQSPPPHSPPPYHSTLPPHCEHQHPCQSPALSPECASNPMGFIETLHKHIDSLHLHNSFAERRLGEILDEETKAMHQNVTNMEEELRSILLEVEAYINKTREADHERHSREVEELNSHISDLEKELEVQVQQNNIYSESITQIMCDIEKWNDDYFETICNIHKTYQTKIESIAVVLHVSIEPATPPCDCSVDNTDTVLFENNLSCTDRIYWTCNQLMCQIKTLEGEIENMNKSLVQKEWIICDMNDGVQLLSAEVSCLRLALDETNQQVYLANDLDGDRVDQLEQLRCCITRLEMQSKDLCDKIRGMEEMLRCSEEEKQRLESTILAKDEQICALREEERFQMMSMRNALETLGAENTSILQLKNEAHAQVHSLRNQLEEELHVRTDLAESLRHQLECATLSLRAAEEDRETIAFTAKTRERAFHNQIEELMCEIDSLRRNCQCISRRLPYNLGDN